MPIFVAHGGSQPAARLFKQCREALGMTPAEMQDELCVMDLSTITKIERGRIDVHGPTWVALRGLVEEKLMELVGHEADDFVTDEVGRLADANAAHLESLIDQIDEYIEAIRRAAGERRRDARARDARRRGRDEDEYIDEEEHAR